MGFPQLNMVVVITQNVFDNPLGEQRNLAMLTRYILPSVLALPSAQPPLPGAAELDRYVGDFDSGQAGTGLKIIRKEDTLYLQNPDIGSVELIPKGENRFSGTVFDIVDFDIHFTDKSKAASDHLTLHLGLRHEDYERIE